LSRPGAIKQIALHILICLSTRSRGTIYGRFYVDRASCPINTVIPGKFAAPIACLFSWLFVIPLCCTFFWLIAWLQLY